VSARLAPAVTAAAEGLARLAAHLDAVAFRQVRRRAVAADVFRPNGQAMALSTWRQEAACQGCFAFLCVCLC